MTAEESSVLVQRLSEQPGVGPDYARRVALVAPRERVFDAITTPDGLRGWWPTTVTGSGAPGGELCFGYDGSDETIVMRIDSAIRPSSVQWTCAAHTRLPDWNGTTLLFDLVESGPEACELSFRHSGLTPELECYDNCEIGWNYFLASLVAYVEHGEGTPFRGGAAGIWFD